MSELHANCSICSLACPLVLRGGGRGPLFTAGSILSLDWDERSDSKYGGSLCARGNAAVEFLTHPDRLGDAFVLGDRAALDAAVAETASNLAAIIEAGGPQDIGIILGENLTVEEASLAAAFAQGIGTRNIALFAPDDMPLFRARLSCDLSGIEPVGPKPPGERRVALFIGDSFSEHPCTAKLVLPDKYGARGSEVIVVSPEVNHTAWFANRHLRCLPGGEAAVALGLLKAAAASGDADLPGELAAFIGGVDWNEIERLGGVRRDDITGAADSMLGAVRVRTYLSNIFGRMGSPGLASLFAEALTRLCPGEADFEPQFVQQNTWGIYRAIAGAGDGDVIRKLGESQLQAIVILGLDLFSAYPAGPVEKALREKKFTVTTQLFWNRTASRATVVVPAAALMEKRGTVRPTFDPADDFVRHDVISPPGGAVTDEAFLRGLAEAMEIDLPERPDTEPERKKSFAALAGEWSGYTDVMREIDTADTVLIPWSEPAHAADGSLSRNFNWSSITCPAPALMMSREYANELKLSPGDTVAVSTEGGEATLPVEATDKLAGHVVGATIHFPGVRRLFPWKLDGEGGEIRLAPVPVTVKRQGEKS